MSDFTHLLQNHLEGHLATINRLGECREVLTAIAEAWVRALKAGKKFYSSAMVVAPLMPSTSPLNSWCATA